VGWLSRLNVDDMLTETWIRSSSHPEEFLHLRLPSKILFGRCALRLALHMQDL